MARPKKVVPLTTAELFYINQKAHLQTVEQIASDIGKTVEEVAPHIPEKPVPVEPKSVTVSDLIKRQTRSGADARGVAVMTPGASELADATRGSRVGQSRRHTDCIHKPLGD